MDAVSYQDEFWFGLMVAAIGRKSQMFGAVPHTLPPTWSAARV